MVVDGLTMQQVVLGYKQLIPELLLLLLSDFIVVINGLIYRLGLWIGIFLIPLFFFTGSEIDLPSKG